MLRALLAGAFGLVPTAAAGVIVVPKDQPTIQAAVDVAVDGDVIQIRGGVYTEPVVITNGANLLITGKGKVRLVAPLDGTALTLDGCTGVTLQKLRFEGPGVGLVIGGGEGTTVRKCRFQYVDNGILVVGGPGATIEDSVFLDIRDRAVSSDGGPMTITDNRVRRARFGFHLSGSVLDATGNDLRDLVDSAFFLASPSPDLDSTIEDNRINRCWGCGIWFDSLEMGEGQFSIRRNVIRNVSFAAIAGNKPVNLIIEKNTLRGMGTAAVQIPSTVFTGPEQVVLLENDVSKLHGYGFDLLVHLPSSDIAITNNSIVGAGLDGLRTSASAISGNQVLDCDRFGVRLVNVLDTLEDHSTLTGNTLLGSRLLDLFDPSTFTAILPDNTIGSTGP